MDTLPEVLIDGHADTKVAFIPNIIDYVLREILKNSFRWVTADHDECSYFILNNADFIVSSNLCILERQLKGIAIKLTNHP